MLKDKTNCICFSKFNSEFDIEIHSGFLTLVWPFREQSTSAAKMIKSLTPGLRTNLFQNNLKALLFTYVYKSKIWFQNSGEHLEIKMKGDVCFTTLEVIKDITDVLCEFYIICIFRL